MTVYRNKQRKTVNVTVGELDLDAEQARQAAAAGTRPRSRPPPASAWRSIRSRPISPAAGSAARRGGAIVTDVERNSPAANGGVLPGDVILEVNRQKVANVSQVTRELQSAKPASPSSCWCGATATKCSSR